MKNKTKLISGSVLLGSLLFAGTAFAAGTAFWQGHAPGVFGTVSAISGDTLTVASKGFGANATATTYTVDATNATVTKNNAASSVSAIAVGDTVAVQGTISGSSVTATSIHDGVGMMGGHMGMKPGVFGTVASVSGDTLTVTSQMRGGGGTATTYTVNATNATVTKNGTASSVSSIAMGDMVMVEGPVSGTSVTATTIRDGMPQGGAQSAITGNGQPVVGGTVTAISGDSLTVTNKSNVTYTVDVTSAAVSKAGVTGATISSITVGDNVVIQGTVNGTSVTASTVVDQGATPANGSTGTTPAPRRGIMGAIGGFFSHLFGFF